MIRTAALAFGLTLVAVGTSAQTAAPPRNACTDDRDKLCVGVKPGEGRVIACLVPQRERLSPGCIEMLTKLGKLK